MTTTVVRRDPATSETTTITTTASPWSPDDRALMLAWRSYLESLCQCGEPKATAWHPANGGWYEVEDEGEGTFTCHACTAIEAAKHDGGEPVKPVRYYQATYTRGPNDRPLPEAWTEEEVVAHE